MSYTCDCQKFCKGREKPRRVSSITTGNKVNRCLNSRQISLTANHAKTSGATRPIDRILDESPPPEEWDDTDTEETGSPQNTRATGLAGWTGHHLCYIITLLVLSVLPLLVDFLPTPQHGLSDKVSHCFLFFTDQVLYTGPCRRNALASTATQHNTTRRLR